MAQATNVIHLPHPDFSFKPLNFLGRDLLKMYQANEVFVSMIQRLLELTPAEMKEKVGAMNASVGSDEGVAELIGNLNSVTKDFEALRDMSETTAARLIAVHAKLV